MAYYFKPTPSGDAPAVFDVGNIIYSEHSALASSPEGKKVYWSVACLSYFSGD